MACASSSARPGFAGGHQLVRCKPTQRFSSALSGSAVNTSFGGATPRPTKPAAYARGLPASGRQRPSPRVGVVKVVWGLGDAQVARHGDLGAAADHCAVERGAGAHTGWAGPRGGPTRPTCAYPGARVALDRRLRAGILEVQFLETVNKPRWRR